MMTEAGLKVISDGMNELGLNYGFGEYKVESGEEVTYPYFVGEFEEIEPLNEDGMQETTFLLTGFSRDLWQTLVDAKGKIQDYFNMVSGKTVIAEDGTAVAVFYSNSLVLPSGDAELKKIQINLDIREWRVN
jgi:hypothetical protein